MNILIKGELNAGELIPNFTLFILGEMDHNRFQIIQFVILFLLSVYSYYQTIQFIRLFLIINLFFIENKNVRYKEMDARCQNCQKSRSAKSRSAKMAICKNSGEKAICKIRQKGDLQNRGIEVADF